MKELSLEQKAQRYDRALERAREWYNDSHITIGLKGNLEDIFPELKEESEDERIRKYLINYVKSAGVGYSLFDSVNTREAMLAWLEKQESVREIVERCKKSWYNEGKIDGMAEGLTDDEKYQQGWHDALEKQCGIDNHPLEYSTNTVMTDSKKNQVEPRFKVGDWIVNNVSKDIFLIKSVNSGYCSLEDTKSNIYVPCLPFESDFHLWTIQDAKDGDVLATNDGSICIFDGTTEEGKYPFAYYGLTRYGFEFHDIKLPFTHDDVHPATKEQRDLLFSKMKEAGYEWNDEKKELKKISQEYPLTPDECIKSVAWSDVDELMLLTIIQSLERTNGAAQVKIDWLKKLKQRIEG